MGAFTYAGQSIRYNYTGGVQTANVTPGIYRLEVYGARGGCTNYWGGYATGIITLKENTIFNIYCGGAGTGGNSFPESGTPGGWNGGGYGYSTEGSGGGGTDIRINGTSLYHRVIVAGGAGGGTKAGTYHGGGGGGETGQNGSGDTYHNKNWGDYPRYGTGGTQTSGGKGGFCGSTVTATSTDYFSHDGSFGQGGDGFAGTHNTFYLNSTGGGGGWYGGGGGGCQEKSYGGTSRGAGGGSGYVLTASSYKPPGYALDSRYYLASTLMSTDVNNGDGYTIITCVLLRGINIIKTQGIATAYTDYTEGVTKFDDEVTVTVTTKPGYRFSHWGDEQTNILNTSDIYTFVWDSSKEFYKIYAYATPCTDIKYTVNYYVMNLDLKTYKLYKTECFTGTTDTTVIVDTIQIDGFVTPAKQSVTINGDGSSVVNYYYTRGLYTITVTNGKSDKYNYYYEEQGNLIFTNIQDTTKAFLRWYADNNVFIKDITNKKTWFIMPPYNINFFVFTQDNRLNSNIYKNIFPEGLLNMDIINKSINNTIVSTEDIKQNNHGLEINDFVYFDNIDNRYKKALAEDSIRASVKGVVSKVASPNVFTLMDSGKIPFSHLNFNDTTILYLSDKTPGKAVHYSEISNTIYIPVAVYIENNIIINLQQGSIGDVLTPYEEEEQSFETYTEQELNDVVNQITNGVK